MIEIRQRIHHYPDCRADDQHLDLVLSNEYVFDDSLNTILQIKSTRQASAWVTPEFIRDAIDPLESVGRILTRGAGGR